MQQRYLKDKQTNPSWPYEARTMEGEEYALEVTHVQWTENIMSIINTATITMLRMLTPSPSLLDYKRKNILNSFLKSVKKRMRGLFLQSIFCLSWM